MATSPPALSAVPEFPALSNRTTYNALAYAFGTGMRTTVAPELAALAANVYSNAVDAYDNASATASDRLQTTADVNQAEIYKNEAGSERGTAQAAAVAAAGSAVTAEYWAASASATAATAAGGAFRNMLINGSFDICQRGTSFSYPSGGIFVADRWVSSFTQTVTNFAQVERTSGLGGKYALSITPSNTGNVLNIQQVLESLQVARIKGKTVTISFTAYCASGTNTLYLRCLKNATADTFGGGSWSIMASSAACSLTPTPTLFSFSCSIPNDGTANGVAVAIQGNSMANGVANYLYDVQLEIGTVATPFEARPIGVELALCQRYYFRVTPTVSYGMFGTAAVLTTASAGVIVPFPVPMRAVPSTLEQSGTAGDYAVSFAGTNTACTSVPAITGAATTYMAQVNFTTGATLTPGQSSKGVLNGTTSGFLGFSAELYA